MTSVLDNIVNGDDRVDENYRKVCKDCKQEKTADEFYPHPTNVDRLFHYCKKCANEKRRAKYNARKNYDFSKLDRVQQFVQGYRDPSELDDDEVMGSFIRDSDGKPVRTSELRDRFHAKFTKELARRLNDFIREKSPRAVQVIFEIADNDLYEAADRFKAAQWIAERMIGKTPDVLITATTELPYQSILEGVSTGGSRAAHRAAIDADFVEIDEDADAIAAGINEGIIENSAEHANMEGSETSDSDVSNDDGDDAESVLLRAETIERQRQQRLEAAKRIRKAKKRRIAARAVGATSLSDHPWLVQVKPIRGSAKYKLRLIPPDEQTPTIVERVLAERSWQEPTTEQIQARRAEAAKEQVAMIQAKLERLGVNEASERSNEYGS